MDTLHDHLVDHNYFRRVLDEDYPNEQVPDKELVEVPKVVDQVPIEVLEDSVVNQVPTTCNKIPDIHHKSRVYVDNLGFRYYKREEKGNRTYLVCEKQKNRPFEFCPCTAVVSTNLNDNRIRIRYKHNHGPADIDLQVPLLREEVIGARGTDHKNMDITVDNNAIQYPEVAENFTLMQGPRRWNRMHRHRQPNIGRIPQNIYEFTKALLDETDRAVYSRRTLQSPSSAFFQQKPVATATTVGINGISKTVPSFPTDLKMCHTQCPLKK